MTDARWRRAWPLLLLGLLVAMGLLVVAKPGRVVSLAAQAHPAGLAAALVATAAVTVLRGLRLRVVVGPSLSTSQALGVHAVTQLATSVVPMRLGEAAILPLLHRAGVPGLLRGFSVALTVRLLDLLALLTWASAATVVRTRTVSKNPAALGQSLVGWAVRRLRRASPRRRRILRQILRVRGELRRLVATPRRAAAAVALSLAAWGGVWGVTVLLLRAMNLHWPATSVLWGTLGAAAGAALPINAVGNFGSLEAGWTAALAAVGIPAGEALAAGFATHAWSLVFNALLAVAAAPLLRLHDAKEAAAARASARAPRRA